MKITKEQLNQIIKEETLNIFKENNDWYDDEHESFADLKSDPKLHQSFDEDPDALSQLAGDNSFLARLADLEDLLSQQLESGEITRQEYDDTMEITAAAKKRTIKKALGLMKEASEEFTPMMPPKPVKPKGVDVPLSKLEDGIEAAKAAIEAMYAPGSIQYQRAMEVVDRVVAQQKRKPPSLSDTWEWFKAKYPEDPEIEKRMKNPFLKDKE
tara:strand:+ start:512 stop:1147 length:636 start_codon:yes stop_codon:yes gene_type:complete